MIQLYIEMEVEVILAMRRIFPLLAHIKGEKIQSFSPSKKIYLTFNKREAFISTGAWGALVATKDDSSNSLIYKSNR